MSENSTRPRRGMRCEGSVMTVASKGRELFIVGNSVSGWTGLRLVASSEGLRSRPTHNRRLQWPSI